MKKSLKKKVKENKKHPPTTEGQKNIEKNDGESEKAFDFGGIPDRNLKKNLGC